jgi:hypothetical protein
MGSRIGTYLSWCKTTVLFGSEGFQEPGNAPCSISFEGKKHDPQQNQKVKEVHHQKDTVDPGG